MTARWRLAVKRAEQDEDVGSPGSGESGIGLLVGEKRRREMKVDDGCWRYPIRQVLK